MAKKSKKDIGSSLRQLDDKTHIFGAGEVVDQKIVDTIENNFMPYAMSVIMSRAIPEIDGFKPSHRKILYMMYKMGLLTGARAKSAKIVGQVMQLNPHGDAAIYDTMNYIKCDVSTICIGMAASMGAFLLSCGAKGKRIALPNAEVMIHQPSAGTQGKVTDMEIDVEHFLKIKQRINKILAENTGKTPEQIKADSERDNWMVAEEAREYGLVDKVIYKR